MRGARIRSETGAGYYHCISRVIERKFMLGAGEKRKFREVMRSVEGFCAVKVLTYCVLENHWHILVHVPERQAVSDSELIRRMKFLYPKGLVHDFETTLMKHREDSKSKDESIAEYADSEIARLRDMYIYRMYDLSEFMKTLKQRFTMWYNKKNGRHGTMWEDRFRNIIVEGCESVIMRVAAYIDLNPVRAGIVNDPKDYRFSGYGEAMGGCKEARAGINAVMLSLSYDAGWERVREKYRVILYEEGQAISGGDGRVGKPGFNAEEVQKVLSEGGKLSQYELLRCRVRYFSDGVAFGSKEFVEAVFSRNRDKFGLKRKSGARRPKVYGALEGLYSMRDLRVSAVHLPQKV